MVVGELPDVMIRVLDFGVAKTLSPSRFSQTAQALGTAYYMAPEQMVGGKDIDHRVDLYHFHFRPPFCILDGFRGPTTGNFTIAISNLQ
jgi:serine/threonine protein kinase